MWAKYINENSVEIITHHSYTDEELQELNILPYKEIVENERYYNFAQFEYRIEDNVVVGEKIKSLKQIDDLKNLLIREVKDIANKKLANTDWMVIRKNESGTEIPESITSYRAAVRAASNEKEQQISSIETFNDIIEFENQVFIETHKVVHFMGDDVEPEYGPDTEDREVTLSGVDDLWPEDPNEKKSPSLVSRVKAPN